MNERSAHPDAAPGAGAGAPSGALLEAARAAYENGRRHHAGLAVPFEAYAERAARRAGSPAEAAAALARAAHGDLYLALGCEVGAPGAWESFCGTYRGRLEALLLARGEGRGEAEALAADLLADLALPPPRAGARTLLGTYDGSGSLFAWLAVILARRRAAAAARRPVALTEAVLSQPRADTTRSAASPDPLDALLEGEAARDVRAAVARAWAGLSDRERLLLVLKHRHGAKQTEIAALLGVGAPRVSRVLDRAVAKIRRALARIRGGGRFEAGPPLWESLKDAVAQHLVRTDVARIDAPPTPPRKPEARRHT